MSDLDERLRTGLTALADELTPESTSDEAVERLRAQRHRAGTPGRRWLVPALAAVVAVVLAIGAIVVLADGGHDETDVRVGPGPTEADDGWDPQSLGAGWHDLPAGPLGALWPRAMVWTGDELIVWRGESTVAGAGIDRGASFDPSTMSWAELPPDPLDVDYLSGEGTGGVWTGTEALFWTADNLEVVAWNPTTESWRASAPPPGPHAKNGVWTGDELVFWADRMAYDPDADTWREIARPSQFLVDLINDYDSHGLVWTGEEIVVVGALTGAYNVATNSWREFGQIAAPQPNDPGVIWDSFTVGASLWDEQVIAFDGSPTATDGSTWAQLLDLENGEWRAVPDVAPPLQSSEGWPDIVPFDDGRLLVRHAGEVYLRGAEGSWTAQPPSQPGVIVGAGDAAFVYGSRETGPFFQVFVPPSEGTAPAVEAQPVELVPGWNDLGSDPLAGRSNPILVHSEDELFLWGGEDAIERPLTAGSAYDLTTGTWRMLPGGYPLQAGANPGAAWTGEDLVVWSGQGVAMLAPDGDTWRAASWPPPRYPIGEAVWVGDRIVWLADGLAYLPADDEWIDTATPPVAIDSPRTAVEGDRLAVLGMAIPGDRLPYTVVFEYSVVDDEWRELPAPGDLSAGTTQLTFNEGALIAADYDMRVRRLPPGANEWNALPDVPLRFYESYLEPYSVGKHLVVRHGAGYAVLDGTDNWIPLPQNGLYPLLGTDVGLFGYGSAYGGGATNGRLLAFVPSPLGADGRYVADSFVLGVANYLPPQNVVVERWSTEPFGPENRIVADITSPSGAACRAVATYQPGAVEGVVGAAAAETGAQRFADSSTETVLVPDTGVGARYVWTPLDQGSDTIEFFCPDTGSLTDVIQGLQPITF